MTREQVVVERRARTSVSTWSDGCWVCVSYHRQQKRPEVCFLLLKIFLQKSDALCEEEKHACFGRDSNSECIVK